MNTNSQNIGNVDGSGLFCGKEARSYGCTFRFSDFLFHYCSLFEYVHLFTFYDGRLLKNLLKCSVYR